MVTKQEWANRKRDIYGSKTMSSMDTEVLAQGTSIDGTEANFETTIDSLDIEVENG